MREAAGLVESVLGGGNLTAAFEALMRQHAAWPDATRGAVRDLAWGTLRDFGRGDTVLRRLLHKPLPTPVHALLLVALHRLEERPEQAYIVVDQAVEAVASHAPGLKGVANGVLRSNLRQAEALRVMLYADPAARYRHPAWWVEALRKAYPEAWEGILEAGNQHPPMGLRVNRRRATEDEAEMALREAGHGVQRLPNGALLLDKPVGVAMLPGFAEGRLSVQDAGAQWAAPWLDLSPGQRVLDACSAPGGKAAHILERADVDLLALELDGTRAQRVRDNFARLGLTGRVLQADCRRLSEWWDRRPFDRILADVPCSASGVVRRHPDIKWLRRREDIPRFAAQQAEILDALWQVLAPGGKMLYVTCSVFEEENRIQMMRFCGRHEDHERLEIDGRLEQQLLPTARHDGFFYALLRKRG